MDDLVPALHEIEMELSETIFESERRSDDFGCAYESEARLMDEKQVLEICTILDIPRCAINNYKPMRPPSLVGAGRVHAFREDEKREFLTRPEVSQECIDEVSLVTARLTDSSTSALMNLNEEHPWESWPPISTCDEFQISVNEIRKRAAWAWYRTGMLCELAASGNGDNEKDKGSASDEKSPMSISLFSKSERAKSHALSLFPDLLQEEPVECPSWAQPFTADDKRYYMELSQNQEYVRRVKMAEIYKHAAQKYMLEAINLYLEQRQERDLEETPGEPLVIHAYGDETIKIGKYGCLSRLWWESIQWYGAGSGLGSLPQRLDFGRPSDLQWWWVRAAQARGHAEWLIKERRDTQTVGHTHPIESWRLLPPGTIGQYDNSCAIWTLWLVKDTPEDDFLTDFNITSDMMRGHDSINTGWPRHSFLYGAPEFVFLDLARNSPGASLIGLLPTDTASCRCPQMHTCVGVYDRYMRRGVQDTLDKSAPDHLRTLARCADDILAEAHAEAVLKLLQKSEYTASGILPSLVSALQKMLSKRVHMTLHDAEDCKFDELVCQCIKFYLDKARHMLHWQNPLDHRDHQKVLYLIYVEREVSKLLAPWFDFHLRATWQGGQIFIQLRSLLTKREVSECIPGTELILTSQPVWKIYEGIVLIALNNFLEEMRTKILQESRLPPETRDFIAPFRSYLISGGNPDLMPIIKCGDMETERRELTMLGFFREETSKHHLSCDSL